jgi:hypothetical protein
MKVKTLMVDSLKDHLGKNFNSVYKPLGVFGFCAVVTWALLQALLSAAGRIEGVVINMMEATIQATKENSVSQTSMAAGIKELTAFTERLNAAQTRGEATDRKQLAYWEETREWQKRNVEKLSDVASTVKDTHEGNKAWQKENIAKLDETVKAVQENGKKIDQGNVASTTERKSAWADFTKDHRAMLESQSKMLDCLVPHIQGKTPTPTPAPMPAKGG